MFIKRAFHSLKRQLGGANQLWVVSGWLYWHYSSTIRLGIHLICRDVIVLTKEFYSKYPSGHSKFKLTSMFGQYHCTTLIDLVLTSCWPQIANIIWIWGHNVKNVSKKWPLANKFGESILDEKKSWLIFFMSMCWCQQWCQFHVDSWHYKTVHFWSMVDGQLTSTVDIILTSIWMSFRHFLPTGEAGAKMCVLCLDLIYFCLSVRALVEVKHAQRI